MRTAASSSTKTRRESRAAPSSARFEPVREDLKSRNGTFVNGKEVKARTLLKDKDKVKICDNLLAFYEQEVSEDDDDQGDQEQDAGDSSTIEATLAAPQKQVLSTHPSEKLTMLIELGQELSQTFNVEQLGCPRSPGGNLVRHLQAGRSGLHHLRRRGKADPQGHQDAPQHRRQPRDPLQPKDREHVPGDRPGDPVGGRGVRQNGGADREHCRCLDTTRRSARAAGEPEDAKSMNSASFRARHARPLQEVLAG